MSMLSRFATLGGGGDPYWANVSYLLVGNGANGTTTNIKDSSSNNLATTVFGNTVISTAQSVYGGSSVYFDGIGDYLTVADSSVIELSSNNFTIEFWINTSQTANYSTIISRSPVSYSSGDWSFLLNNGSSGNCAFYSFDICVGGLTTSGVTINDGAWHYIALVRSTSTLTIYVDGTSRASTSTSGTIANLAAAVYIGKDQYYGRDLNAYLYDLRVTNGVARYSGSTMTIPTAPLPIG